MVIKFLNETLMNRLNENPHPTQPSHRSEYTGVWNSLRCVLGEGTKGANGAKGADLTLYGNLGNLKHIQGPDRFDITNITTTANKKQTYIKEFD